MNTKVVIVVGTLIAALAFIVEIIGFDSVARPIFMMGLGLGLALVGVVITLFHPPNTSQKTQKLNFFYRLSIIGFLIAAVSIMLGNYLEGQGDWVDALFRVGAGLFVVGAVLPIFFSCCQKDR